MLCPNCNFSNEGKNVFCVNCGANFNPNQSNQMNVPPTVQMPSVNFPPPNYNTGNSVETSVLPNYQQSNQQYQYQFTPNSNIIEPPRKPNTLFWVGGIFVFLLILGGAAAYFLTQNSANVEVLPEHFGLFSQDGENKKLSKLKKQEFTSLLTAKEDLEKDDDLPVLDAQPNLILFAENNDIPYKDLKLIEIDSIKDDGSLKQVDFQAAPVDGKPEMKRMRVAESIAEGKYAFALIDGFMDDGKHKLWAFEIKDSGKSSNGDLAKNVTLDLKPKEEKLKEEKLKEEKPKQTPVKPVVVSQPPNSSVGYVKMSNVIMRSGPSQNSSAIGKFRAGQKVYILYYSDNYEYFQGQSGTYHSNYARVITDSGKEGWIYAAFIR